MHFYNCIGDHEAALQACREALNQGGRGYVRSQAAAALYRARRYEDAKALLRWDGAERNPWILFGRAEALAFTRESPHEVRKIYERLLQDRSKSKYHIKYHVPEAILLQQDDPEYRKAACRKRLNSRDLDSWERQVLKYVGDETNDEAFLQAASQSLDKPRLNLGRAEKLVGMKNLLKGDRKKAEKHFKACLDVVYLGDHYDWARALLMRLGSDATWPEWSEGESTSMP